MDDIQFLMETCKVPPFKFTGSRLERDGATRWYKDGKKHREDGPAVIYKDPREFCWFYEGQLHRDGGPASVYFQGPTCWHYTWFKHGFIHREDGPAQIIGDYESWWCYGQELTSIEHWAKIMLRYKNLPEDPDSIQNYIRPILQKLTQDLL